ncbi:hypothetical protein O9992_17170 [Vibrio lentus]|nr:hypothetical protein [Vibrio lentus]
MAQYLLVTSKSRKQTTWRSITRHALFFSELGIDVESDGILELPEGTTLV